MNAHTPASPDWIMIVEDSPTQAARLQFLFEEQGWASICVTSAEAALEELNKHLPAMIVSDFHLPGMAGNDLCRRIRMNVNTRSIPILMLTADDTNAAMLQGLESGADDYVPKSVPDDILVLRVASLQRTGHQQQTVVAAAEGHFRQARILVIDDSPTYRAMISAAIAEEGLSVAEAANGEEGLERVRNESFDCVIVDLMMPGLDGIEVCRRLVEFRRALDNPIVVLMLTSKETRDDMARGLDAGADDFVGKSSDIVVLKARIHALLRRKFFQEENQRIIQELKNKELEALRALAAKEAAEARAELAAELAATNRELEAANTKLKETHAQLMQSEKMASLGQLVAGIAHEINNPLSFVGNNLYLVQETVEKVVGPFRDGLPDNALARLEKMTARLKDTQAGVERVKDLVQKLRTFSRLDAGVFGKLNLPESIDMVLKFLHHKLKERIVVEINFDAREEIDCYAGEFNQVLMNLVANAIDAIEDNGTIRIETFEREDEFVLCVNDDGGGIPEHIKHRIFEPFFTTKPVGHGMGLGLSLTYSVVQAHGGKIDVRSEPGQGTTFEISVPLNLKERMET